MELEKGQRLVADDDRRRGLVQVEVEPGDRGVEERAQRLDALDRRPVGFFDGGVVGEEREPRVAVLGRLGDAVPRDDRSTCARATTRYSGSGRMPGRVEERAQRGDAAVVAEHEVIDDRRQQETFRAVARRAPRGTRALRRRRRSAVQWCAGRGPSGPRRQSKNAPMASIPRLTGAPTGSSCVASGVNSESQVSRSLADSALQ